MNKLLARAIDGTRCGLVSRLMIRLAITLTFSLVLGLAPEPRTHAADFDTQIMPVLTRSGCNAGACHGAAAGRGGFHLSLLGSDPASDYAAIVHGLEGRRVHRTDAKQSLLVRKPTGDLAHGGDVALDENSRGYQLVLQWLSDDVPRGTSRVLTDFRVTPTQLVVQDKQSDFTLSAIARFDHGPPEDVTDLTLFTAEDADAVSIELETNTGRILRPGQHVIIARYLQQVVPIQITLPVGTSEVSLVSRSRNNFIDQAIYEQLEQLRLAPADGVDDLTFLRRVTLDLTGRLPTREEVEHFSRETAIDKRPRLIDRLLASSAFVDYWTLRISRLVRLHSLPNETQSLRTYSSWLRDSVAQGLPWNQFAYELITATGDSYEVGPANFGRMVADARAHAELVGSALMGVRLGCANCHDHPLDKWTQDDYHGLAAVFAKLDRGRIVQRLTRGDVTHPRTTAPALPRIPGQRFVAQDEDALQSLANWIVDNRHGTLARAQVNRLWSAMFGQGLVQATDDLRETNPASHPHLLNQLTDEFIQHDYDLRHALRLITHSETYARRSTREGDRFYAVTKSKTLPAEVLADAFGDVTGVPYHFSNNVPGYGKRNESGEPRGPNASEDLVHRRAVHLLDPLAPAPALDTLGRCNRAAGCDESILSHSGLATQLHLVNGDLINQRLSAPEGRLRQLLSTGHSNAQIVDEFYQRALGRPALPAESEAWLKRLDAPEPEERRIRLEDFLWSLLCSQQFQLNH